MRNYLTKFFLLMVVSFSVAAKDDVVKVYDKGLDGNMRIYSIGCPNGKKTTITQMFGAYGKAERSAPQNAVGFDNISELEELMIKALDDDESEDSGTNISSDTGIPTVETTSSIKQTATDLIFSFFIFFTIAWKSFVCNLSMTFPSQDILSLTSCTSILGINCFGF